MENNRLYEYVQEVKELCNNAITIESSVEKLKSDIEAMCVKCLWSDPDGKSTHTELWRAVRIIIF